METSFFLIDNSVFCVLFQEQCDDWDTVPSIQLKNKWDIKTFADTGINVQEFCLKFADGDGQNSNIQHPYPITPVQSARSIQTVLPVPLTAIITSGHRDVTHKKDFASNYNDCITFEQCISSLSSVNQMHMEQKKCKRSSTWRKNWVVRIFFGPPQLERRYIEQRAFIYTLSRISCKPLTDRLHGSMLYTVFKRLTGSSSQLILGEHWKLIGFQGTDPETDFRGAGLLALLCLVFLVTELAQSIHIRQLFRLSIDPVQNFPFACVGINITSNLLEALCDDQLNRLIHVRKNVLDTFLLLYCALFFKLGDIWTTQKCTICDMSSVLKQLQQMLIRNPEDLLKWYQSSETSTD
ncbi:ELMO domain-containing protein 3 [Fasciola gigantica]|uniref:ELMO domain-containing protein 3 n=1 Tax=Fasciola gigantica TaxID=46835 RepID=A0A504YYL2_FASGI|nr:ELMO domain-containing protein 3 [Fasciola gigantica]